MRKTIFHLGVLFFLFVSISVRGQQDSTIVETIQLEGPRVGFTIITGELADRLRSELDVSPFITQIGWQFENRFFTTPSGTTGLVEGILLVGGVEQNVFLPSASFLIGLRNKNGTEFGVGPNLSLSGAAFVFAGGVTLQSANINFPINLALVPSSKGVRISLLVGFNARKR